MRTFAHQSGRTYHLPLRLDEADRQQLQAVADHHGKPTSLMTYLLLATAFLLGSVTEISPSISGWTERVTDSYPSALKTRSIMSELR